MVRRHGLPHPARGRHRPAPQPLHRRRGQHAVHVDVVPRSRRNPGRPADPRDGQHPRQQPVGRVQLCAAPGAGLLLRRPLVAGRGRQARVGRTRRLHPAPAGADDGVLRGHPPGAGHLPGALPDVPVADHGREPAGVLRHGRRVAGRGREVSRVGLRGDPAAGRRLLHRPIAAEAAERPGCGGARRRLRFHGRLVRAQLAAARESDLPAVRPAVPAAAAGPGRRALPRAAGLLRVVPRHGPSSPVPPGASVALCHPAGHDRRRVRAGVPRRRPADAAHAGLRSGASRHGSAGRGAFCCS